MDFRPGFRILHIIILMAATFSSDEHFWDNLLSRDPHLILEAFRTLDNPSRQAVLKHLHSMSEEDGWLPQQRDSALVALEAIEKEDN